MQKQSICSLTWQSSQATRLAFCLNSMHSFICHQDMQDTYLMSTSLRKQLRSCCTCSLFAVDPADQMTNLLYLLQINLGVATEYFVI